jgi:molybdenum cofactor cytidylyltransferase
MRNVGGIVLAAGGSARFGQAKQLISFQSETLVRRAARAALDGGCARVTVVAGEFCDRIEMELHETLAAVVENPEWSRGLGTSIRCGVRHLVTSPPELEAVVVLACDQPFVDGKVIRALIAQWENSGKPIVASSYAGTLGIPALFDHTCFGSLLALPDTAGAKSLIESRVSEVAQIEFEKGAIDIDTPADLAQINSV